MGMRKTIHARKMNITFTLIVKKCYFFQSKIRRNNAVLMITK